MMRRERNRTDEEGGVALRDKGVELCGEEKAVGPCDEEEEVRLCDE